jgi:hypothetical protein
MQACAGQGTGRAQAGSRGRRMSQPTAASAPPGPAGCPPGTRQRLPGTTAVYPTERYTQRGTILACDDSSPSILLATK